MSYLKVFNPIDKDVKTGYKGEYFTVKAKGTETFPVDLANRFVEIYPFMEFVTEEKVTPKKVEEEVKEVKKAKK